METAIKSAKGITGILEVFTNYLVIKQSGMGKFGLADTQIYYKDILEYHFKDVGMMSNGQLHFAIIDEEDPTPPSLFWGASDINTIQFKSSQVRDINLCIEFIEGRLEEIRSGHSSEELQNTKEFFNALSPCSDEGLAVFREATEKRDWEAIYNLNRQDFSKQLGVSKEFGVLHEYLQEDEVVFGFTSGLMSQTDTSNSLDFGFNTWLCVLTDKRILALDHAMLSSSVDTQSIRHDKIQSVSASQGFMYGKIIIDIGNRSIVVDNCEKSEVKRFAELANEWLEHRENQSKLDSGQKQAQSVDVMSELEKLSNLKDKGILDDAEFTEAKRKLLDKL